MDGRGIARITFSRLGGCLGVCGGRWVVADRIVPSVEGVEGAPVREKVESALDMAEGMMSGGSLWDCGEKTKKKTTRKAPDKREGE